MIRLERFTSDRQYRTVWVNADRVEIVREAAHNNPPNHPRTEIQMAGGDVLTVRGTAESVCELLRNAGGAMQTGEGMATAPEGGRP